MRVTSDSVQITAGGEDFAEQVLGATIVNVNPDIEVGP